MALTQVKTSNILDNAVTIDKLAVTDGTAGQVLVTDGNGNLSFSTVSGGGGGGSGISNLVEDTSPQLGGTLDANGNNIDMGANEITDAKVLQWDTAYGWGDHQSENYVRDNNQIYVDNMLNTPSAGQGIGNILSWTGGAYSWITQSSGGLSDIVDDTSPQLGGDLDTNGNNINFNDGSVSSNYVSFGDDADLKIFHNGGHSIVRETGTGSLYLQSDNNVILSSDSNTKIMVKGIANGATELYHNDIKKFVTTADGVEVTGTLNTHTIPTGTGTLALTSDTLSNLVDDTSPQLGGVLNCNGNNIVTGNNRITYADSGNVSFMDFTVTQFGQNNNTVLSSVKSINFFLDSNGGDSGQAFRIFNNANPDSPPLEVTYIFKVDESGDTYIGNDLILNQGSIVFEGATANTFETTLQPEDPTADRQIILPDVSGTILTTGNSNAPATTTSILDADFVLVDNSGTMKKMSPSDLVSNATSLGIHSDQIVLPSGTTDPTQNLTAGGMYFNSSSSMTRVYNGNTWGDVSVDLSPFGSLLTTSMPHSGVNVSEAGIRTETASFTGATDNGPNNLGVGFGWHDGHEGSPADWPAYIAVYIGNQYPGGKPVNKLRFCIHGNSFGNFELQGSNDANTSGTFYNTGNWTSIPFQPTGSYYSNQNGGGSGSGISESSVITFLYTNSTPYTHYRIWFKDNSTNGSSGNYGGWACYGWEMSRV